MPDENLSKDSQEQTTTPAESLFGKTEPPKEEVKTEGEVKEAPKAEEVPPLTEADVKFPEGVEVNKTLLPEFLGVMNNKELSAGARAQALIDLQVKLMSEASEKGSADAAKMREDWVAEVKKDPDYNTEDKLGAATALISKSIDQYGTPEVRQIAALTGAGDNIHMIRYIHKLSVAAKVAEGTPLVGSVTSPPKSAAQILYPDQGKK